MSMSSIKYFLREGFKNVWVNRVMSAASMLVMVCCMILTGGAVLISYNVNHALKSIENRNNVNVFLKKEITPSEAILVGKKIEKISNIATCEYYSSDKAAEKYKDVLGSLYEVVCEKENPFPEAFHISMKDLSLYEKTVSDIKEIDEVESVGDRSETAQKLSNLSKLIAKAGLWVVCSLGLVSLFIISNTIRISMHSRRFEISIMKSVGATNGFIRARFIIEGMIIGLVAAVISTLVLEVVYNTMWEVVLEVIPFSGVIFKEIFWKVLGCFAAAGTFFGVVGSFISIRRYLSKEGGNVVAW